MQAELLPSGANSSAIMPTIISPGEAHELLTIWEKEEVFLSVMFAGERTTGLLHDVLIAKLSESFISFSSRSRGDMIRVSLEGATFLYTGPEELPAEFFEEKIAVKKSLQIRAKSDIAILMEVVSIQKTNGQVH